MTHYVLGFAFTPNLMNVALIEKIKVSPGLEWMQNKLNGLGGKVRDGESHVTAMSREFCEESGVCIPEEEWRRCGTFCKREEYEVHVFRAVHHTVYSVETHAPHEGPVGLYPVDNLRHYHTTEALKWILPLITYPDLRVFRVVEK